MLRIWPNRRYYLIVNNNNGGGGGGTGALGVNLTQADTVTYDDVQNITLTKNTPQIVKIYNSLPSVNPSDPNTQYKRYVITLAGEFEDRWSIAIYFINKTSILENSTIPAVDIYYNDKVMQWDIDDNTGLILQYDKFANQWIFLK